MLVQIESLDQEGRGIAHVDGKAIFIDGAITGEEVTYSPYLKKAAYERAKLERIVSPSAQRVAPLCPHFGVCGGCAMQHVEPLSQVAAKQRVLEDNLARIGKVVPEELLAPIHGPSWGYRQRARLAVRYVAKKATVVVGFHEKRSGLIAVMDHCHTLAPRAAALIAPLRALLMQLSVRDQIPQIDVAVGESVTVLVLRLLRPLAGADEALLRGFCAKHTVQWWLQPAAPASARPFYPENAPALAYSLPEFGLKFEFLPSDFTQVNFAVNAALVRRAVALLAPREGEQIADLFCGLGNFSLALAARGAQVLGVEASADMVERARENAALNGLESACRFLSADLYAEPALPWPRIGACDKWLLDPPRDGAFELVRGLAAGASRPSRIVYVSCNPATLARDASVLVHEKGYRLRAAGVVNMFPHTAHVESIALFCR